MDGGNFWNFNLGHAIELGVFLTAAIAYRLERRKDATERTQVREKMIQDQTAMHTENRGKLDTLAEFHKAQQIVNTKRDEQITQLATQTATLSQIAQGQERRLQMLEDRVA